MVQLGKESYNLENNRVRELIEEFGLTYNQARRTAMNEDGMTHSEIATVEGVARTTVQGTIEQGRIKMANPDHEDPVVVELRFMPEPEVREYVLEYISKQPVGGEIYASDIAFEYGIDIDCVEAVMDKMVEEGVLNS